MCRLYWTLAGTRKKFYQVRNFAKPSILLNVTTRNLLWKCRDNQAVNYPRRWSTANTKIRAHSKHTKIPSLFLRSALEVSKLHTNCMSCPFMTVFRITIRCWWPYFFLQIISLGILLSHVHGIPHGWIYPNDIVAQHLQVTFLQLLLTTQLRYTVRVSILAPQENCNPGRNVTALVMWLLHNSCISASKQLSFHLLYAKHSQTPSAGPAIMIMKTIRTERMN